MVFNFIEIGEHNSEHDIYYSLEEVRLPDYMRMPMVSWIKYGRLPGNFLQALLRNDLCDAVNRADDRNMSDLFTWVKWLQNCAPSLCWGSPEKVKEWQAKPRQIELKPPVTDNP